MSEHLVCRRVEDQPGRPQGQSSCSVCGKPVYVEEETSGTPICIYCAPGNEVIFVELPPDEFGRRSISKSVEEVRTAKNGRWQKDGEWHSQQWALGHIE